MKRMGSAPRSDKKAVALGRDMLKRPSQPKINLTTSSNSNVNPKTMNASVSMSAFSPHHNATSSSKSGGRYNRERSKDKLTLKDSFTLFLQNEPQEEINQMTQQIVAAMKMNQQSNATNKANEDFDAPSPSQQQSSQQSSSQWIGRRRKSRASHKRSASINNADIPTWKGYKPKSSSRRGSRAGNELLASMKLNALKQIEELEVDDDDDTIGNANDDNGDHDTDDEFGDDLMELGLCSVLGEDNYVPVKFDELEDDEDDDNDLLGGESFKFEVY